MNLINRRKFFAGAGAITALAALPKPAVGDSGEGSEWAAGDVANTSFRLSLSPRDGLKNTRLLHLPSGLTPADADYSYSFGRPTFRASRMVKSDDGSVSIHLEGSTWGGNLEVHQRFYLPQGKAWMEEEITLTNRAAVPLDLSGERCGFVLPLALEAAKVMGNWKEFKFTAVPYRRVPQGKNSQYFDFSLDQILNQEFRSELMTYDTKATPVYASEGWTWTDGKTGFLMTKYSQRGMEWSILDRVPMGADRAGLRWGGIGTYLDEPEHGAWLAPGESHRYGVTRFTAYQGGMLEGFYTFRQEMTERGHGCPPGFNPPIHWEEAYDNKLLWLPAQPDDSIKGAFGDPEMRKKYYRLEDMKEEAAKAKAIGCQALYLDPGWDTLFGSQIWDETRLGTCQAFVEMLRRDYGLKLSLHTPLSGWTDPTAFSPEMYRMDRFGQRLAWDRPAGFISSPLCGACRQYVEENARRLKVLARDGATFLVFDGTVYRGECWDPQHGHPVPARAEEHAQAVIRLARMVHAEYPQVIIEMHDPVSGGSLVRATPTYYGHGQAGPGEQVPEALGPDEVWAFEMWGSDMGYLTSGHAIALYYYNLAYGLPLYLHIDIRVDNANALWFWWVASTCRHLGIGGTPSDAAVRKAHYEAMATYRRLESFFKAGTFYGLGEMVHVHVHPSEPAAVVNCFNLEDHPVRRRIEIDPAKLGLDASRPYEIKGATARRDENRYVVEVGIPSQGHVLLEMVKSA